MNDRSAKQIDVDPSGRMVFQMRFWRSFRPLVGEQGLASVDSTSFISLIHYSSLSAIKFSRANMKRIALKTISWWSTWPDWPLTQQHAASSNHNRFITSRINLEQRINNRSCPFSNRCCWMTVQKQHFFAVISWATFITQQLTFDPGASVREGSSTLIDSQVRSNSEMLTKPGTDNERITRTLTRQPTVNGRPVAQDPPITNERLRRLVV